MSEPPKNSKAWYLLPVFLFALGGVIMFLVLRKKNSQMAKQGLILGVTISVVWFLAPILSGAASPLWFLEDIEEYEYESNNFEKSPDKQKLEIDKQKLEIDKQKLEAELAKLEVVKQMLEAENSDRIVSNDQCSLFCDSNNYEPVWAKSMGKYQATSKCQSIVIENFQSKDGKWCIELLGKILDDQYAP